MCNSAYEGTEVKNNSSHFIKGFLTRLVLLIANPCFGSNERNQDHSRDVGAGGVPPAIGCPAVLTITVSHKVSGLYHGEVLNATLRINLNSTLKT